MKKIRRHKQSISLLAIAGILLILAFYISQQTRSGDDKSRQTVTSLPNIGTLSDLPDCAELLSSGEGLACYVEAAQISEAKVLSFMDELLTLEPEMDRRIAMMGAQIAWEDSRDADCTLVRGAAAGDDDGVLQEMICRTGYNLSRLEQLEQFRCDWYDSAGCEVEASKQE